MRKRPRHLAAARATSRTIAMVGCGVAASGLLLLVLLQIDIGPDRVEKKQVEPDEGFTELIPRRPPETDSTVGALGERVTMLPDLDQGGWIETFDRTTGKLAQRYRFERLDPNPPNRPPEWALITRPQAEIYGDSGQVLVLTANTALVYRPHGLLESGSMTGNVTIRQFDLPADRPLDLLHDTPTLKVTTAHADFDNFLGQIRCDGSFRAETAGAEFMGRRLSILINDVDQQINELTIDVVDFVRLAHTRSDDASPGGPSSPTGPGPAQHVTDTAPTGDATVTPPAPAEEPPPPTGKPPVFYNLVLHENVRVEDSVHTLTGDRLAIVFSTKSAALGGKQARGRTAHPRGANWTRSIPVNLVLASFATFEDPDPVTDPPTLAPPRSPDDIYITCSGGLIMTPLADTDRRPESPSDAHLTLSGRPARLHDADRDLDADCAAMIYESLSRTVRLIGTENFPLEITSPEFSASGEVFFYGDVAAAGGFSGPGELSIHREAGDVHVDWRRGVDLAFGAGNDGGPGPLERAVFRGDALATSAGGEIAGDVLDLAFATNANGESVAKRMVATGNARATDKQRTIWADNLNATFREVADAEAVPAGSAALAGASMDQFEASGNVQISLGPEGRVFADQVNGESGGERVVLTGESLSVAQGGWLLDGGHRIELDDSGRLMDWPGAGRARLFGAPLVTTTDGRVRLPAPAGEAQLVATWNEALTFNADARNGAGDVNLSGAVHVISRPNPHEIATLDGDVVTLELAQEVDAPATATDGPLGGARRLERIVAVGDARLESRRQDPGEAKPRLFYIAGPRLWYSENTGEGEVIGPGDVLVRDERPEPETAQDGSTPMLRRGTTGFKFTERLSITRRDDGLYDVDMIGGIEMRNLGLAGETTTLAAQSLHAVLDRAPPKPGAEEVQADIRALRAEGDVFLRMPERDVACEILDYDVTSGVAELHARPGAKVIVYPRNGTEPMRFDHARWDMEANRITVLRPSGGG